MRRIDALPGLTKTAFGMAVPWREQNGLGPAVFRRRSHPCSREENVHCNNRGCGYEVAQ